MANRLKSWAKGETWNGKGGRLTYTSAEAVIVFVFNLVVYTLAFPKYDNYLVSDENPSMNRFRLGLPPAFF